MILQFILYRNLAIYSRAEKNWIVYRNILQDCSEHVVMLNVIIQHSSFRPCAI